MKSIVYGVSLLMVLGIGLGAYGQAVRIDVVGSGDTRVGVAVPDFAAAAGLESIAKEMAAVVKYDLYFTGLFQVLPPENYPRSFTGFTSDATQINFADWQAAKVNYLVYAYVTLQGDSVTAECRMFDTSTGTQVLGQRLSAARSLPRLVAHRFSEEIVRTVDGVPGIGSSQICFSSRTASGNKEIFVSDYDGQNVRQVTKHNSISIKPKFSPDGKKIAYLSYKDRYPFLYVLDLASGKSSFLSKSVGLNSAPAWAPDSQQLALTLSKDGNTEIYVKSVGGGGERRLTNERGSDTQPTFDPTGKQIAFVSDRAGQPQIFVMNADGSNQRRLSYQGGKAYDPVWSPDGKMIAFTAERSGEGFQIYVMNADGSNARRLTEAGTNESPSWSADSRNVIFSSSRAGQDLWAANATTPVPQQYRIPMGNGMSCEGPSWGPRR